MLITLIELENGEVGEIVKLEGGLQFKKKLSSLNIRVGKEVKKIASQPFNGPLVMKIDNTKITIGRGMASKIILKVER
ncbi:MAG: ferrous iron transport protein A [Candidatus Aenigmarchaeota archaeon]|nr:ferrous iron transport protein A [Candidatus Aenigmarchaeota archaeon]